MRIHPRVNPWFSAKADKGFRTGGVFAIPDGWDNRYPSPFLSIEKEEVCDETGGSCMAFRLVRREGEDLLDIHGHITDADEIAFLYINICKEGIDHSFPQDKDIDKAMSDIRAVAPPSEQN